MAFRPGKTFINLPVKDLKQTMEYFSQLGFEFNPQFTDENATCMVMNDSSYAMLLVEPYFQTFSKKELVDTSKSAQVLVALAADSREQVDEIVDKALEMGGSPANDPQDHGFMYTRSFQDINGHIWEVLYMDPATVEQ